MLETETKKVWWSVDIKLDTDEFLSMYLSERAYKYSKNTRDDKRRLSASMDFIADPRDWAYCVIAALGWLRGENFLGTLEVELEPGQTEDD